MEAKKFSLSDFKKAFTKEETTDVVIDFVPNLTTFQIRNGGNSDMGELTNCERSTELEAFIEKLIEVDEGSIDNYLMGIIDDSFSDKRIDKFGVRRVVSMDFKKVKIVFRIVDRERYLNAWSSLSL